MIFSVLLASVALAAKISTDKVVFVDSNTIPYRIDWENNEAIAEDCTVGLKRTWSRKFLETAPCQSNQEQTFDISTVTTMSKRNYRFVLMNGRKVVKSQPFEIVKPFGEIIVKRMSPLDEQDRFELAVKSSVAHNKVEVKDARTSRVIGHLAVVAYDDFAEVELTPDFYVELQKCGRFGIFCQVTARSHTLQYQETVIEQDDSRSNNVYGHDEVASRTSQDFEPFDAAEEELPLNVVDKPLNSDEEEELGVVVDDSVLEDKPLSSVEVDAAEAKRLFEEELSTLEPTQEDFQPDTLPDEVDSKIDDDENVTSQFDDESDQEMFDPDPSDPQYSDEEVQTENSFGQEDPREYFSRYLPKGSGIRQGLGTRDVIDYRQK